MDITFIIVIFLIGFVGSFVSGMLGIGGSIIKYPMLLYLPPLFGLVAFSAHEVSGISAVQVFLLRLQGFGRIEKVDILISPSFFIWGAILAGSFVGSYGSQFYLKAV